MLKFLKRKRNPAWYQGMNNQAQHFEGWYFKLVDHSGKSLFAIIPGIFKDRKGDSHSFIQIFDGIRNSNYYFKFPARAFKAKQSRFEIELGENYFSDQKLVLSLQDKHLKIEGEVAFEGQTPWPGTLVSPGIMGWYTWAPFMECYHGVVSLNHTLEGTLSINNQSIDFSGGKGYTEKDWGKSFPKAWVWCQSNHFNTAGTSLTASIAIIPWIRKPFLGFIIGLWHKNILYRFATYNGARLEHFEITETHVTWLVQQGEHELQVIALRTEGGYLQAPVVDGMINRISESLKSKIEVTLSRRSKSGNTVIFNATGIHAGLEVAGDLEQIMEMYAKYRKKR